MGSIFDLKVLKKINLGLNMSDKKPKTNREYIQKTIKPLEKMLTTYEYILGSPEISSQTYKNTFSYKNYNGEYSLDVYLLKNTKGIYSTDIRLTIKLSAEKKKIIDYSERKKSNKSGAVTLRYVIRHSKVRETLLNIIYS